MEVMQQMAKYRLAEIATTVRSDIKNGKPFSFKATLIWAWPAIQTSKVNRIARVGNQKSRKRMGVAG